MQWIGLTGGIASGKSSVSGFLREAGVVVVCADELAREAVQPGSTAYPLIAEEFGPDCVLSDGSLDRKKLGEVVFGRPERLRRLEELIHPYVRDRQRELRRELERSGRSLGFYDVPLLFEKGLEEDFDVIIVVVCSESAQLSRLMKRNGLDRESALARIGSQLPLATKRARADFVIENDGSLDELRASTMTLLEQLRRGEAGEAHG